MASVAFVFNALPHTQHCQNHPFSSNPLCLCCVTQHQTQLHTQHNSTFDALCGWCLQSSPQHRVLPSSFFFSCCLFVLLLTTSCAVCDNGAAFNNTHSVHACLARHCEACASSTLGQKQKHNHHNQSLSLTLHLPIPLQQQHHHPHQQQHNERVEDVIEQQQQHLIEQNVVAN